VFKPASQSVERYQSVLSCALNMEDLISNEFCKLNKQYISNVIQCLFYLPINWLSGHPVDKYKINLSVCLNN
jgi:hypothetical protein